MVADINVLWAPDDSSIVHKVYFSLCVLVDTCFDKP